MTRFITPRHGEMPRSENMVIGHYGDMAIIINEKERVYFIPESDENQMPVGTIVEDFALTPLSSLSAEIQQKIMEFIYDGGK